jgi:PKHD-type hydroxylase
MLSLRSLLTRDELATINARLDGATWVDGRETAAGPTRRIKDNRQVGIEDPIAVELGALVEAALMRNDTFRAATFPDRLAPVRFAAYGPDQTYGWHADMAHMRYDGPTVRSDVACTVFLSAPESYQGGELAIRLSVGELRLKMNAGDAVVYPATTMPGSSRSPRVRVASRSRGSRVWCRWPSTANCCSTCGKRSVASGNAIPRTRTW